jgi:enoyl-CoA hydratase/carnithine racemase
MTAVDFSIEESVATICLNRPAKLNTITAAMAVDIAAISARCNEDDRIRAVVLTGAGDRAFCAGSDIGDLDSYESAWTFRNRTDYCDSIRAIKKPVICAVNGHAYGGGLELCLNSDIRMATANANFCAAEIKLGWIGGGGVTFLLVHNIGASNAAKMLLTGEPINAKEAHLRGLVSEVYEPDVLLPEALRLAKVIAERPPIAAQVAKDNLRAAYAINLETAVRYERDLQAVCMGTEDANEGRMAFREKRAPLFKGK